MSDEFVFKVNLGGMIDILSNHLYSNPGVFIRELLQNGTDAISGIKKFDSKFFNGKIVIEVIEGKSITFIDNGVGLTKQEIHDFLAVIGQSSKKDLNTGKIFEDYIGRFGIGLLSCFMVTDEIILTSCSAKDNGNSYTWSGKPDGTYTILKEEKNFPVGTKIVIRAKKDCEEYFTCERVEKLVRYYGLPLPFPIILKKGNGSYRINEQFSMDGNVEQSILDFGESIFNEKFMGYIPLESKSGLFSGVAYILPYQISANAQSNHRIYLKNMLLTEDGSKIMPKWAFFLKCFINTSKLRPTASRENFYEDDMLEQARNELSECISSYLKMLSFNDPLLLEGIIGIHSLAIKSMCVEQKNAFSVFMPFLKFSSNFGEINGKYLLRYNDAITYTTDINRFQQASTLMLTCNKLLVNTCYVYDNELLQMLSQARDSLEVIPLSIVNFDDFLDNISSDEEECVNSFVNFARDALDEFECDVQVKKFTPTEMSVFFLLNNDAQLFRDLNISKQNSDDMFFSMLDSFSEEIIEKRATLYFNYNNSLVKRLSKIEDVDRIKCCTQILYVQSLLTGHYPLKAEELTVLNDNIVTMLEWGMN